MFEQKIYYLTFATHLGMRYLSCTGKKKIAPAEEAGERASSLLKMGTRQFARTPEPAHRAAAQPRPGPGSPAASGWIFAA